MNTYKDLDVYLRSYQVAIRIHELSLTLPHYLQRDLADQMRRSSRSVPANIAEGYSRNKSRADIVNFLKISLGSNNELLFYYRFARDVKLISVDEYNLIYAESTIVGKQLKQLIRSLDN